MHNALPMSRYRRQNRAFRPDIILVYGALEPALTGLASLICLSHPRPGRLFYFFAFHAEVQPDNTQNLSSA